MTAPAASRAATIESDPAATDAAALAERIGNGASLALAPDYSGCALAIIRELIRRDVRDLHLIGCPQLGLQAELLIAQGCVRSIETAAIGLGEHGIAPAFDRAYRAGHIDVLEATCPAIHSGLQAAEKGVPFLPLAGVLGSDLIPARPDWHIIDDPFGSGPILTVPAIRPDIALFHAPLADRHGNVWIGTRRELMLMAHASHRTLVTTERLDEGDLLADARTAAGTIPALYVDALAVVEGGAAPCGLFGEYPADQDWITAYVEATRGGSAPNPVLEEWLTR